LSAFEVFFFLVSRFGGCIGGGAGSWTSAAGPGGGGVGHKNENSPPHCPGGCSLENGEPDVTIKPENANNKESRSLLAFWGFPEFLLINFSTENRANISPA